MLRGIGVSEGIGIGRIFNYNIDFETVDIENQQCEDFSTEVELSRLQKAIEAFAADTKKVAAILIKKGLESEAEIMKSHISLVEDRFFVEQMNNLVLNGKSAAKAISESFDEMIEIFSNSDDQAIKQRSADFRDIKQRLLGELNDRKIDFEGIDYKDAILCMEDINPSFAAIIEKDEIAGIVSYSGGYTSHAAILLRAKEIPAVFSVKSKDFIADDLYAIVDGEDGFVIIDPASEVLAEYEEKKKIQDELLGLKDYYISANTVTACGQEKKIYANVADINQARKAHGMGAGGIGLFRSEFLYMDDKLPTEEEQFSIYKSLGRLFSDSEVVIRTLDAGGDKPCKSLKIEKEENPFLGQRGIRFCLDNIDIFKTQLRSLLRAAYYSNIKICLPMVTCVSEVLKTKELISECISELEQEGLEHNPNVKLGVMIETPSACIIADYLAQTVDFFSIGTNDLSGYVMAADRGNRKVSYLCNSFEPALIRLLAHVCKVAHENNIEVSICGEAASDIRLLPLLLSFGIDKFSVNGERIWRLRREIAKWKVSDANEVARCSMSMTAEEKVEMYLKKIQEGRKKENEY